jgi:hypothetical protein
MPNLRLHRLEQPGGLAVAEFDPGLPAALLDALWAKAGEASPYQTLQALAADGLRPLHADTPLVLRGLARPADASEAAAVHLFNLALIEQLGAFPALRLATEFYDEAPSPALWAAYLQAVQQPGARVMLNLPGLNKANTQACVLQARPADVPADRLLRAATAQRWRIDGMVVHGRCVAVPADVQQVEHLLLAVPAAPATPVAAKSPAVGALPHAHRLFLEGRIAPGAAASVLKAALPVPAGEAAMAGEFALQLAHAQLSNGHLEASLDVLDATLATLELAPLRALRGELGRHLAGLQLKAASAQITGQSGFFASAALRPVHAADHRLVADVAVTERIAIVMQGPVLHDHGFTLETLRLYRRLFPGVSLLLSTWIGEDVAAIEADGFAVLQSEKPPVPGPAHINYQATSARNGIRHAMASVQPDYVLKTRTDMRLHNPNLFADLLALLEAFPLSGDAVGRQQQRLVVFSDVVKYMLHAAPDKNMFGAAADMLGYWSPPADERSGSLPPQLSMRAFAAAEPAEVYLLRHHLRRIGRPFTDTLADHFAVLRDHFVVCDRSAADLYWHKYNHHLEYRFRSYGDNSSLEEFGFNDWLRLRSGRYAPVVTDAVLDAPSGSPITSILQR